MGPSLFAIVVLLAIAFVIIEMRSKSPLMIRLGILRDGTRARVQFGAMTQFGAYFAFQFIATLYLQQLLGWTPLQTALAFLPLGVFVAVTASQLGRIVGRFGPRLTMLFGFTIFTIALALFLGIGETSSLWHIIPTMVLMGVGNPLMYALLNILNAHGVKDQKQGMAAGILNASLQIGGAIFLAIVTAVVNSNGGDSGTPQNMLEGYHAGLLVTVFIAGAGLVLALVGLLPVRARRVEAGASSQ